MGKPDYPPASFTPSMEGYTGQGAFRYWCQTALPLVYDDSLSYYELLNKVVVYLNNVISDVSNAETNIDALLTAYNQLQDYVNTYFNGIDIQDEINNKLDEMAGNGELTALISPFIPDLVTEWLTEHITPTTPIVDNTLSISGAAADAKTTGDEIENLQNELNNSLTGFNMEVDEETSDGGSTSGNTRIDGYFYRGQTFSFTNNGNTRVYANFKDTEETTIQVCRIDPHNTEKVTLFSNPDHLNLYTDAYPLHVVISASSRDDFILQKIDNVFDSFNIKLHTLTKNEFVQGYWLPNSHPSTPGGDHAKRIRTENYYKCEAGTVISFYQASGYKFSVKVFSKPPKITQTALEESPWIETQSSGYIINYSGYFTISVAKTSDANILPEEFNSIIVIPEKITNNFVDSEWADISDYIREQFVTGISHTGSGEYIPVNNRNAIVSPLFFKFDILVNVSPGCKCAYQYYDGYNIGSDHLTEASGWIGNDYSFIIPANTYFCLIAANMNDSITDATTQNGITFYGNVNVNDLYYRLMPLENKTCINSSNYVVGTDLLKRNVNVDILGKLTYGQAFCIYDNKYYSTDGSNISVQDANFNEINSAAISIGHGNSLQIGSANIAYASGWDDNNVYAINLNTLSIDNTITLPTTGYTTCAVDDVSGLIYIFQRDTYPDTVDTYNFIVYDYVNDSIISEKPISVKFSTMQACDFFNDRIIVLNGWGTTANPNGYHVYDVNGNILADYYLPSLQAEEPEGVCLDRNTHELYISIARNNAVFKIT